MNASFVNELHAKNPIFQAIAAHLETHRDIKELSMPDMVRITRFSFKEIHEVMTAIHRKANIGSYKIGRKGNPNRFVFDHYPADVVGAALDPVHSSDPIPKKRGRPINIYNDAGKIVPQTDTRAPHLPERHVNVSVDAKGIHIEISQGVELSGDVIKMILDGLRNTGRTN